MNPRLQAEIWEIQMLLMWIVSFLLIHFSTLTIAHTLGWALTGWSVIIFLGINTLLIKAKKDGIAGK